MHYKNLDLNTKSALNLAVYIYSAIKNKELINSNTGEILNDNHKKILSFFRAIMYLDYNDLFDNIECFDIFTCIYFDKYRILSELFDQIICNYNQKIEYKGINQFLIDIINYDEDVYLNNYSFTEIVRKVFSNNKWICEYFPNQKYDEYVRAFKYYCNLDHDMCVKNNDDKSFYDFKKPVDISDAIIQMFGLNIEDVLDKPKKDISNNSSLFLSRRGYNLTKLDYKYDPSVGRDDLIEKISISLETPMQQVILIGMPGVGKTAIVKGLAKKIKDGKYLKGKEIIEIDASSLISGMGIVGSFEKNMEDIIGELEKRGNIILFIDEIHQIYNMGIEESNVMNILKKPISEGKIKIIGSTTKEEYDNTIKLDNAFTNRFDIYFVDELKSREIRSITLDRIGYLEEFYNNKTQFTDSQKIKFVNYLIDLTDRKNRKLNEMSYNPRLIIQIIDLIFATAKVKHPNESGIKKEDIIYAVTQNTRIKNHNYPIPDIFDDNKVKIEENKSKDNVIDFSQYVKKYQNK